MPPPCQPQKPRWDQPVGSPYMPKPPDEQAFELANLMEKFKQGLQSERVYVTECLEKHHAALLTRLAESCGTSLPAVFPALWPSEELTVEIDLSGEMERSCSPGSTENIPLRQLSAATISTSCRLDKIQAIRRLHARMGKFTETDLVPADTIYAAASSISFEDFCLNDIKFLVAHIRTAFLGLTSQSLDTGLVEGAPRTTRRFEFMASQHEFSIPFGCLVDVLLKSEEEILAGLGCENQTTLLIRVRDTLLSSDTNCMVAEILNLRADDVSKQRPKFEITQVMEPFFAAAITLNAILIGLSTNPNLSGAPGMFAAELCFTTVFTLELIVHAWFAKNCRTFFCGKYKFWHLLDIVTVSFGWMDAIMFLFYEPGKYTSSLSILRLARFSKFIRLIKIARLKFLSELTLMIQGLVVGARTLFWAVVLLVFVLYVISILLTMSIGQDVRNDDFDREREDHFSSVSRTAFTTFRCTLVVDCGASSGSSLLILATRRYGWAASVSYAFCFLVINLGLINLIMAVFVDNTMRQAQKQEYQERVSHNQDSVRVANQLKEVLVKICQVTYKSGRKCVRLSELGAVIEDAQVTREDFLLALQDESLQKLMDDLDIPPERARLFDVLDADGSGHLDASEILDGLLKVRGESRRSDTVGTLLAVRALQNQVRGIKANIRESHDAIVTAISKRSVWQ